MTLADIYRYPGQHYDHHRKQPLARQSLGPDEATDLAGMFKAPSGPIRLRVLSAIATRAGGEACVCDVSEDIDVTQPTISHHGTAAAS
ncbi:transcriptional regulator [Nocardia blacklockiae]|nr:transcriptional regulator [Nocardia blacklockiae]